jgi:hypothetical protein
MQRAQTSIADWVAWQTLALPMRRRFPDPTGIEQRFLQRRLAELTGVKPQKNSARGTQGALR